MSHALLSQVDVLASLSAFIGQPVLLQATDSQNQLNAILGKDKTGRKDLVIQAGGNLALVEQRWKYIIPSNKSSRSGHTNIELGNSASPQLYDLKLDPGEKTNLADKETEVRIRLEKRLEDIKNTR